VLLCASFFLDEGIHYSTLFVRYLCNAAQARNAGFRTPLSRIIRSTVLKKSACIIIDNFIIFDCDVLSLIIDILIAIDSYIHCKRDKNSLQTIILLSQK